jgi:predicted dithiol-disulfide oxidoreductase (DUF899 family)
MTVKSPAYDVREHDVVAHDEWIDARKTLLAKEKDFTRLRDELSQARRDLPWERVEKTYVFDGPDGKESLSALFGSCSQLVVYHFMFGPDWDAGCKSCSFWADNFNGIPVHLRARDITFAAISHAPLPALESYEKRMGWSFKWLSSYGTDFNRDFGVTFTEDEAEGGRANYNYAPQGFPDTEAPGVSVFFRDGDGAVYHTYSSYGRGIDILNGAYNYIDLTPKGRDEGERSQSWVRRHDEYGV